MNWKVSGPTLVTTDRVWRRPGLDLLTVRTCAGDHSTAASTTAIRRAIHRKRRPDTVHGLPTLLHIARVARRRWLNSVTRSGRAVRISFHTVPKLAVRHYHADIKMRIYVILAVACHA